MGGALGKGPLNSILNLFDLKTKIKDEKKTKIKNKKKKNKSTKKNKTKTKK